MNERDSSGLDQGASSIRQLLGSALNSLDSDNKKEADETAIANIDSALIDRIMEEDGNTEPPQAPEQDLGKRQHNLYENSEQEQQDTSMISFQNSKSKRVIKVKPKVEEKKPEQVQEEEPDSESDNAPSPSTNKEKIKRGILKHPNHLRIQTHNTSLKPVDTPKKKTSMMVEDQQYFIQEEVKQRNIFEQPVIFSELKEENQLLRLSS